LLGEQPTGQIPPQPHGGEDPKKKRMDPGHFRRKKRFREDGNCGSTGTLKHSVGGVFSALLTSVGGEQNRWGEKRGSKKERRRDKGATGWMKTTFFFVKGSGKER